MPTRPEAFLGMPGASGLQSCAWTHLKKSFVPQTSGWWDGRQIPLINIWTDLTCLVIQHLTLLNILWILLLIVCNLLYSIFLYVSISTGYWCWINILSTHFSLCTFGFVKLLASSGSHCTKWADEQHWQAGFESRLLPDFPPPFIPTLIGLRAFDLVSSRVWWEAATNTTTIVNSISA